MKHIPLASGQVDNVVCLEGLEHVPQDVGLAFLAETHRLLKEEGVIFLTVPVILPGGKHSGNPYHLYEYPLQELKDVLGQYFQVNVFDLQSGPDGPIAFITAQKISRPNAYLDFDPPNLAKTVLNAPEQKILPGDNRLGPQCIHKSKARILLTTSAAPCQSPFSTTEKRPPIGLGFLISVLREAGHKVFFIDNYLNPSNFLETDYLQRNDIDFVGIYANTICYRDTRRMLDKLEYLRQTGQWQGKIIIGGPHTSVALDTIPPFVDYVVQGEGEQAILDIVEGRVAARVVKCQRIQNLDDLPMPAWDYFVNLPYNWGADWFEEKPVFTMNTSRGCPFQCTFCSVGSIWGRKYTYFSAERIVAEIEHLVRQYGAKGIYFREDNFTVNKERTVKFCNLLLEKGIKISWACETRVDTLDRELLDLMVRAGLKAFYFGVESGSQRVLDFLKKGIKIAQTKEAFRLCQEFGVKTAASVIVGVPGETPAELQETMALINEIKPSVCWFNVFVGIPDSFLYRYTLENKLHEFIDDRGLVYLKGHNDRVQAFYGGQWDARVPVARDGQGAPPPPKISVVMAVHNGGPYLEEAIKSIFRQTYQNYEFLIIDDASTDETAQILKSLDDFRVRIITNKENLGLTKSLNLGISQARGEYLARMDADDLSFPHRLEKQLAFLENNPEYALVGSPYYQIDEAGNINSLVKVLTDNDELRAGLLKQNWFGHGSVMMRRAAVDQAGGYDERFTYAQDYDLWLRLADNHRLANLAEPLYCWRATSSCISKEKAREQQHFARLAQKRARERQNPAGGDAQGQKPGAPLPLVSVIVPTYNRPDMLVATLQSILNQTYTNQEIIVVNDCGVDVADIVGWLNQQGNITYVKHDRNRGLAAARNTGLKLARGKYIAYLDDDDLFYPDHLETLVTFLETSDYRIAYTDAHRAHQEKQLGRYVTTGRDLPYSHDFNADHLIVANQFPVLCLMHEKSCLEQAGYFDESLTTHEDWDLWIRLSLHYPFFHIKKVTCEFTWRQDGSTMTNQRVGDFIRTLEIIHAKYQEHIKDRPQIKAAQRHFLQEHKKAFGISTPPPPEPEELLEMATAAMERQDWGAAEEHLRGLTQTYPDLSEAYITLSDVLTLQGKHREAGEVLQTARQVDPEALPLLQRLGLNCRQRGDLSGAMAAFTKAWNRNPKDPEILGLLGATCIDLGLFQEAKGYFQEAVQINPRNIEAWLGLARVAQHLEDQEAFDQACLQAAALNARHPRLRELTKGRAPGNGGAAAPRPVEVQKDPASGPERVLSSIIIPVFNNLSLTRQCLESIGEHTDVPHEIIVVDNGSTDGTREYLNRLEAANWARVIYNRTNLGFAKASNQGAQAAQGEYLVFLNNDTIAQPGWLQELAACARKDAKIAAVGAKLLFPDNTVQHAGVAFTHNKLVYHLYKHYDRDHPAVNKEREFQAVTAACVLIKKDLFFGAGGFDESYRNGFEDVDLCFKLRQQGYKVVYNPRAVVYHLESKTPGRHDRETENSRLFKSRWIDRVIGDDQRFYAEDGIVIEILDHQGNVATVLAHDSNDNFFWRQAQKHRQEGNLDQAETCYLRALQFNPFDSRKVLVARELAELFETLGKPSQAEKMHRLVAALAPPPGLRGGAAEAQECLMVP
jgi:GT2 family glycosyltransferase/tRNA A37 methylthiotransferase MiaB/Flp pilus assembly protein TadD